MRRLASTGGASLHQPSRAGLVVTLATAAACTTLLPASAQAQAARSGEFSIQNFTPAPGPKNFLGVEGARMDGNLGWSVEVFGNYARDPFVLIGCSNATTCGKGTGGNVPIVRDMFTADLMASLSPIKRLQLALRLPLSYVAGQGLDLTTGQGAAGGIKKFGVGDPQLEGKVRFFGDANDPIALGAALDLGFPVGHLFSNESSPTSQAYYLGNSSPVTVGLRGIFDAHAGPVQIGVNLRGEFRQSAQLATTTVGPADFRYGLAAGYRVNDVFRVVGEGFGGTQFSIKNGTNTLELDGALEFSLLASRLVLRPGGGAGIVGGVGVPAARAFLGLAFVHETIVEVKRDETVICPMTPADIQPGVPLPPGCAEPKAVLPPSDRDHDGIPDDVDKCPDAGGPDVIRDAQSKWYGCPDRDHDGVPDHVDKCPDEPEATDELWDGSGCPHIHDRDKDGIPDDVDACPDVPGQPNVDPKKNGCPEGPRLVELSATGIKILERVEFATGKDKIQGAKSFKVLDAVAAVMNSRKDVKALEVQGHTDNAGNAESNRKLSQLRAEAVVKYLVSKGVDQGRLTPKGYGPDKPIADNKKADGRQANRRVEFSIGSNNAAGVVPPPPAPPPPPPPPAAPAPPAVAPPAVKAPAPKKKGDTVIDLDAEEKKK